MWNKTVLLLDISEQSRQQRKGQRAVYPRSNIRTNYILGNHAIYHTFRVHSIKIHYHGGTLPTYRINADLMLADRGQRE